MKKNEFIEELYYSYSGTLKILRIKARRGCKISAKLIIEVLTQRENAITAFGWTSICEDGKIPSFVRIQNHPT